MTLAMQHIIKHLFRVESLEEVPRHRLEELVEEYPSFGIARYLLSRKLRAEQAGHFNEETQKTNLYFSNPLWLQWLLQNTASPGHAVAGGLSRIEPPPPAEQVAVTQAPAPDEQTAATETPAPIDQIASTETAPSIEHEATINTPVELAAAPEAATHIEQEAPSLLTQATTPDEYIPASIIEEGQAPATEAAAPIEQEAASDAPAPTAPASDDEGSDSSPQPAPALSAADLLLQSISEAHSLRKSLQQANEAFQAARETPDPAEPTSTAIVGAALEQAEEPYEASPILAEQEDTAITAETPIQEEPAIATPETPPAPETEVPVFAETEIPVVAETQTPVNHEPDPIEQTTPTDIPEPITPETAPKEQAPTETTEETPMAISPEASHSIASDDAPAPAESPISEPSLTELSAAAPLPAPAEPPLIVFDSYHTIDYFASQGIKLTLDENPSDKLGKQLKSFTEWLKVMRKLPQKNLETAIPDLATEHKIQSFAAHSIEGKEIVTETMAEVLAKQGMYGKAAEVYNKLSLLNPGKSAYFAAKIEQLKIE